MLIFMFFRDISGVDWIIYSDMVTSQMAMKNLQSDEEKVISREVIKNKKIIAFAFSVVVWLLW